MKKSIRESIATTGRIPAGQQLITDTILFEVLDTKNVISEGRNGKTIPATKVTGVFQIADQLNGNKRVYPFDVLREAVQSLMPDIQARTVWGQLDHPDDAKVELSKVSHLITNLRMDGKKIIGEAEILESLPLGKQLRTLMECGKVGVSSRGVGNLEMSEYDDEAVTVLPGFKLVTWDAVASPSVTGCYLESMGSGAVETPDFNLSVSEGLDGIRGRGKKSAIRSRIEERKRMNDLELADVFKEWLDSKK